MSDASNPMGRILLKRMFISILAKLQGGDVAGVIKELEDGLKALNIDLQKDDEKRTV